LLKIHSRTVTFAANLHSIKGFKYQIRRTLQTVACLLFLLTTQTACEDDKLNIDVSHINVQLEIERVDQIWPKWTPVSFRSQHPVLISNHGDVYKHYVEDVLQMGSLDDSALFTYIRSFTTHQDFQEVFEEVARVYPNLDKLSTELTGAWQYYQFYFPNRITPKHMTCVGGFNAPFIMTESGVGICLELYLGTQCEFYNYLHWPMYQRNRMTPDHLTPWLIKGWLETDYPQPLEEANLLQEIIHQGKIFYCMDAILPQVADSLKIGYTANEMQWAQDHETMVWAHFIDNELLFNSEPSLKGKFLNDGPFTVDLVKDSPSRMGHFIGWKMVREYMNKQDVVNLVSLMNTPAEEILKESNYKP
jgi:hypothetical protein